MQQFVQEYTQRFINFFGWYLLSKGVITKEQLLHALDVQQQNNQRFGEFAVAKGLLAPEQIDELHRQQQVQNKFIGQLAVEQGFITKVQLDDILFAQTVHSTTVGEALLSEGVITPDVFSSALEEYTWLEEEKMRLLWDEVSHSPASDIVPSLARALEQAFLRFAAQAVRAEQLCALQENDSFARCWCICCKVSRSEWVECSLYLTTPLLDAIAQKFLDGARPREEALVDFMHIVARYLHQDLCAQNIPVAEWHVEERPVAAKVCLDTCLQLSVNAEYIGLKAAIQRHCEECPCPPGIVAP